MQTTEANCGLSQLQAALPKGDLIGTKQPKCGVNWSYSLLRTVIINEVTGTACNKNLKYVVKRAGEE